MITRETVRHELSVRIVQVVESKKRADSVVTVTLSGESLNDFVAGGPTDHMKVFFPDPATGILVPPVKTIDGSIQRPQDAVSINRDYTPLNYREATVDSAATIDIEFVLHENSGPATDWAKQAKPGDELALVGPRGSRLVPSGIDHVLLIADETALPAFTRWLDLLPAEVKVHAILQGQDESIEDYLTPAQVQRANIEWLYREDGPGQLMESVRSAADVLGERSYIWAAGESTELIGVRRFFKYDLELAREQYSVDGYWKRGVINHDHHAPIDVSDPD